MKLIVGLGNPGEKYQNTRHNIGFMVLDHLLQKYEPLENTRWEEEKLSKSLLKQVTINGEKAILAKPQTYMNNSGLAVSSLLGQYTLTPQDLIVIHDELDLPLGKVRIKFGGGSAGNNGINSLIEVLKTDQFLRFRLGIGKPERGEGNSEKSEHTANYVLSHFSSSEQSEIRHMIKTAIKELELVLEHGYEKYMSQYHRKSTPSKI